MRNKNKNNLAFKMTKNMSCASKIRQNYRQINRQHTHRDNTQIRKAIEVFLSEIKNRSTFVSTVCHRALFPNQMWHCNRSNYVKDLHVVESCLTGRCIHVCTGECQQCPVPDEKKREWICYTCHDHPNGVFTPNVKWIFLLCYSCEFEARSKFVFKNNLRIFTLLFQKKKERGRGLSP